MKLRATVSLLAFAILYISVAATSEEVKPVAVLFSAQSQGTIYPCRCPYNPEGGLARRASVISELREDYDLILAEAGGWAAGGIYDELAQGDEECLKRTALVADFMRRQSYDVIALAEDDLALGYQTLSSVLPSETLLGNAAPSQADSFLTVNGIAFVSVHSAAFPSGLYPRAGLKATDPVSHAAKAIAEARASGAKSIVLLSSATEEETLGLIAKIPAVDFVFVSNRGVRGRFPYRVRNTWVMGLEPLGKAVALWEPGRPPRQIRLGADVPANADTDAMLREAGYEGDDLSQVPFDFYFMSRCPYGRPALLSVLSAFEKLGDKAKLNLYFIVDQDSQGKLVSLHGEEEVEDDRRMLAIWLNKPDKLDDYVKDSAAEGFDFAKWLASAGIDPWRVKGALDSGEIDAELKSHSIRCERLGVSASPTLIVANAPYNGPYSTDRILYALCSRLRGGSAIPACSKLPECYADSDRQKPGYISVCRNPGKPDAKVEYLRDVDFEATVVTPDDSFADPTEAMIESLSRWLPGMKARKVSESSDEGRAIVSRLAVKRLPAVVLPSSVSKAYHFKSLLPTFEELGDGWVVSASAVRANVVADRPRVKGAIDLFISPSSTTALRMISRYSSISGELGKQVNIRFALIEDPKSGKLSAMHGLSELEEAARACAALRMSRDQGMAYLLARAADGGSSYWDDAAEKAGIPPQELKSSARSPEVIAALHQDAKDFMQLSISSDVFLLADNRELIVPVDEYDFEVLLWILCAGH
ncbi:MAG: hypothetical protein Kow00107_04540 [Planctomycetota bacterium]